MTMSVMTLPRLAVTLDGASLAPVLAQRLTKLELRQVLGAPAVLDLSFSDAPADVLATLRPGQSVTVAQDSGPALFAGFVTEIAQTSRADRAATFRLTARDRLHKLACRQSLLALQDVSAADVGAHLAGDVGLTFACREPVAKRQVVVQHEQSDLDFLSDLAAEAGLYPVERAGQLLLLPLSGDGESALTLTQGQGLLSVHTCLRADRSLPGGSLAGRDAVTLSPRASQLSLARQDQIEMRNPGGDLGVGRLHLLHRTTETGAEADGVLQASLDRAAADMALAEGLAEGNPALVPGRVVQLNGLSDRFGGLYVLTRTLHRMTADEGYVTEFSTEPSRRPAPPRTPVTTIAEVTDVADPENLGRARVALAEFSGLASGWMHVVLPGAGARKGLAALPDVGDLVLVLMPEGDLGRGMILGGLYGSERLPKNAEDSPRGIVLRSSDGQVLELAGADGTARLANRSGSFLDIHPGGMRLAAASDLLIEAPGKTITIRAAAIKLERG